MPGTVAVAAGRRAATPDERGRDIYNLRCYFCHGYAGDAQTVAATYLNPPPRDFTRADAATLSQADMLHAVRAGRPGTAMMAFEQVLSSDEIAAVVEFVRAAFMQGAARNTRYHTADNGWPEHERKYGLAFAFALGTLDYRTSPDELDASAQAGRKLFMSACITCHERAAASEDPLVLNAKAVSYPRGDFVPGQHAQVDSTSGASPYGRHDRKPSVNTTDKMVLQGERIYQTNCAFCHAPDGSGKNWIGSFLQPHPRDLTAPELHQRLTEEQLQQVIADGLPNTTMPAWKHVLTPNEIASVARYARVVLGTGL